MSPITQINQAGTLADAKRVFDQGNPLLAVADDSGQFQGLIGDAELRRAMRAGLPMGASLRDVMVQPAQVAACELAPDEARKALDSSGEDYLVQVEEGRLVACQDRKGLFSAVSQVRRAILMVGGEGQRLRPLTEQTPKPLLPIGGRPILEHIVRQLAKYGVQEVSMALGYRAEQIESYFADGAEFGLKIQYLREEKPLGTAGAMGMLERAEDEPLLVMNGDVMSELDLAAFALAHHRASNAVTVATRAYHHAVPYGVLQLVGDRVASLQEKPLATWWTNAGIYLMQGEIVGRIPAKRYLDMTMLIQDLIASGDRVEAFPMYEYWCDIGLPDDYRKANERWSEDK
ncbi:MAG: nucleotidyltransferase family protein [Planctomycetota bacterium]